MSTTGYGLEAQINDLNAELREARAQIADYERKISLKDNALDDLCNALHRAETQIAAKDAALQQIVNECSAFPIKDGLAFRCEGIALNGLVTPARETE